MKAHLIQITVIALTIAGALVASPASARPCDPESFEYPQHRCAAGYEATCRLLPSAGDFGRYVSWNPRETNDGLPRQAVVRTEERPGWSNEVHTIRITATLRMLVHDAPVVIEPPLQGLDPHDPGELSLAN